MNNLHTFALLQKARRRLALPIVATGGIADGHGMAAAFAFAEGVMMGTRFIASKECPWHDNYKQAIVEAEHVISINTSAVLISTSMRAVRTPYAEAVARGEAGQNQGAYSGDARAMFYEGRTDVALIGCGESAVLIDEVKPAGEIVTNTVPRGLGEIERLSNLRKPLNRLASPTAMGPCLT